MKIFILLGLLPFAFEIVLSDDPGINYFSVIGPQTIRAEKDYLCAVSSHNQDYDLYLEVGILWDTNVLVKQVFVPRGQTKMVVFPTKNFNPGEYQAIYVKHDATDYYQTSPLNYLNKAFTATIQLEKPIYKPDDLVRFRIFAYNSRTVPYNFTAPQTVRISDPDSNKMYEWTDVVFVNGIYENEFLLPSKVLYGSWTLSFETRQEIIKANFQVAAYTLPIFTTTLNIPSDVAPDAGSFVVSSSSKYTSGASIAGVLTIHCEFYNDGNFYLEATEHTTGETSFEINLKNDLLVTDSSFDIDLTCGATYIDDFTRKTAKAATVTAIIHKFKYRIEYDSKQNNIKPGLPFEFTLNVLKFDGSPANQDPRRKRDIQEVAVSITFGDSESETHYPLDSMGHAQVTVDVPENASNLRITATYGDATFENTIDSISYDGNVEFLTITSLTKEIKLNENVDLEIRTTEDTPYVYVQLYSKQLLRKTFRQDLVDKSAKVSIKIRFGLTPTFRVVAYYVSSNLQVVGDSIRLTLRDELSNSLDLSLSKDVYAPGENLKLSITSKLESTVCLAAIDHRVSLLNAEGVIDKGTIFDQLDSYVPSSPFFAGGKRIGRGNGIIMEKRSLDDAWFELIFFTNAANPIFTNAADEMLGIVRRPINDKLTKDKGASTKIRSNFAENFLWQTVVISEPKGNDDHSNTGQLSIDVTIPESITTWSLTGISISKLSGIGISKASFDVFLPFFIQLNLPYAAKRNEGVVVDILVFNYLDSPQDVDFIFDKRDNEFSVLELAEYKWTDDDNIFTQSISINSNSVSSLKIKIAAKIIGFITIKVKAVGSSAGDGVEEKLRIIPEGVPHYITSAVFVQIKDNGVENKTLSCVLPSNAVLDTVTVFATVVGDIIGNSLKNIDRLIQIPSGCGEQNMITLVPNIAVLFYLNATNQLSQSIEETAKNNLISGYQSEITYKLDDGSFSAFGPSDGNGSTWLTAFVAKSFIQAKEFIPNVLDQTVIDRALEFVISKQQADGSFIEDGRVIHKDMQGAAGTGLALTCYLAIVLEASLPDHSQYLDELEKALDFVVSQLGGSSSTYELSVCVYALQLHNHPDIGALATSFLSLAIETSSEMHWEQISDGGQPGSLSIEMTAYGLLYLQLIGDLAKSLKVLKWLISQQNSFGGYSSTQDTVVGLHAITTVAVSFTSSSTNLDLALVPDFGQSYSAHVDKDNAFTVQTFGLQLDARSLTVNANGTGFAVVQLTCNCFVVEDEKAPSFGISLSFVDDSCEDSLKYMICVHYIPSSKEDVQSNMVIVGIQLPSGYQYDDEHVQNENISLIVAEDGGTRISVYINSLTSEPLCFRLNAIRVVKISDLAMSTIEIYDFYDTTKKASIVYELPELGPCKSQQETSTQMPSSSDGQRTGGLVRHKA